MIISGRRITPIETPKTAEATEAAVEADAATSIYSQILFFGNTIAADQTIFPNQMVPARHVFFRERVLAFGLFLVTCCYGNVDMGTDIIEKHHEKLSESKSQSQVETYISNLMRSLLAFKNLDAKVRKKHRFDDTAALDEMIPYFLGELYAEKSQGAVLAIREHIFDLLDVLGSHQI